MLCLTSPLLADTWSGPVFCCHKQFFRDCSLVHLPRRKYIQGRFLLGENLETANSVYTFNLKTFFIMRFFEHWEGKREIWWILNIHYRASVTLKAHRWNMYILALSTSSASIYPEPALACYFFWECFWKVREFWRRKTCVYVISYKNKPLPGGGGGGVHLWSQCLGGRGTGGSL